MQPPDPDAVLLDLDGVLYVEDEPMAGAREAVAALRERGLALRFVTNTTARRAGGSSSACDGSASPSIRRARHARSARRAPLRRRRPHARRAGLNDEVKEDFAELEEVDERPTRSSSATSAPRSATTRSTARSAS